MIRFCMAPSDICESSIWDWPSSPLGAWDFWGASYTCGKLVHLCNWVIIQNHVWARLSRRTDSLNCSRLVSRAILHQAHSGRPAKQWRSVTIPTDTLVHQRLWSVTTSTLVVVVVTWHLPEHEYLVRHWRVR